MKKLLLITLLALSACTSQGKATEALRAHGFTNVQIGGYAWFGCGKGDMYSNKFVARNARGDRVSGVVCCGDLKGCTVRF